MSQKINVLKKRIIQLESRLSEVKSEPGRGEIEARLRELTEQLTVWQNYSKGEK